VSPDPVLLIAAVGLLLSAEAVLLARGSGRRTLRRAWEAIHAGQVEQGRQLLQPFLDSPFPRRREPARIALLAAARVSGDREQMRFLLQRIDRSALSRQNRRILHEEEVRVLVELGETQQAVERAQALLVEEPAGGAALRRGHELLAYALLADGRHQAAQTALLRLLEVKSGPRQVQQRAWALYQLGLLRRLERREPEARHLLQQAAELGGRSPLGEQARQALAEAAAPERI
jgi:tetratricopeptide (TPR) repeat protein